MTRGHPVFMVYGCDETRGHPVFMVYGCDQGPFSKNGVVSSPWYLRQRDTCHVHDVGVFSLWILRCLGFKRRLECYTRGHHVTMVTRGHKHFLRTVSSVLYVKEPATKGHLSSRDTCHVVTKGHLSCRDTCHVVMKGHLSCRDTCHVGTPVM